MKKIISIVLAVSLIASGTIYAATGHLWSGDASITITVPVTDNSSKDVPSPPAPPPPPAPEALEPLTVSEPLVTKGSISEGLWSVTLSADETATIYMYVNNPRDTVAMVELLTNGSTAGDVVIIPGVVVKQIIGAGVYKHIDGHSSLIVEFKVLVNDSAEIGTLPNIAFEVREKA